jgi:hypothetical protein
MAGAVVISMSLSGLGSVSLQISAERDVQPSFSYQGCGEKAPDCGSDYVKAADSIRRIIAQHCT